MDGRVENRLLVWPKGIRHALPAWSHPWIDQTQGNPHEHKKQTWDQQPDDYAKNKGLKQENIGRLPRTKP